MFQKIRKRSLKRKHLSYNKTDTYRLNGEGGTEVDSSLETEPPRDPLVGPEELHGEGFGGLVLQIGHLAVC